MDPLYYYFTTLFTRLTFVRSTIAGWKKFFDSKGGCWFFSFGMRSRPSLSSCFCFLFRLRAIMRWNREARDGIRYSLYPILVDVCHYFRLFFCSCFLFNFRFFCSFPRRRFETCGELTGFQGFFSCMSGFEFCFHLYCCTVQRALRVQML